MLKIICSILKINLTNNRTTTITFSGESMYPTLQTNDRIKIKKCNKYNISYQHLFCTLLDYITLRDCNRF